MVDVKPILTKKEFKKFMNLKQDLYHWNKILNAKPSIDTETQFFVPKKSVRQKKTIQLDEEKKTEIERENRILLEKITRILQNKRVTPHDASYIFMSKNKEQKTLSSRNKSENNNSNTINGNMKGSLNLHKRWDEYKRVKEENQRMLSRLMNQKSHFDWSKMDEENRKHDELVSSMCQFPRILPNLNKSISKRCISVSPARKTLNKYINNSKTSRNNIHAHKYNMMENQHNSVNHKPLMNLQQSQESLLEFQNLSANPYLSIQNLANDSSSNNDYQNQLLNNSIDRKANSTLGNHFNNYTYNSSNILDSTATNTSSFANKNQNMLIQQNNENATSTSLPNIDYKETTFNTNQIQQRSDFTQQKLFNSASKNDINTSQLNTNSQVQSNNNLNLSKFTTQQIQQQQPAFSAVRSKSTLNKKSSNHRDQTPLRQIEYLIRSKNNNRYDQNQKRKILFQGQRQISNRLFDVEVSKTKHKIVIICLDVETKHSHVVNLWIKQAEKLVESIIIRKQNEQNMQKQHQQGKFQGISKIIKYLKFIHGTVFLDVPKDLTLPQDN